jgi:hypothetical protein
MADPGLEFEILQDPITPEMALLTSWINEDQKTTNGNIWEIKPVANKMDLILIRYVK